MATKKVLAALKRITGGDVYDFGSGGKYSDTVEPLPNDDVLDVGMEKSELQAILRKNPQMLQSEDGYPFWKVDGVWTNGDMTWGDDSKIIQSVLDEDMTFLVYYKVNVEQFEQVEDNINNDIIGKPDWYDKEHHVKNLMAKTEAALAGKKGNWESEGYTLVFKKGTMAIYNYGRSLEVNNLRSKWAVFALSPKGEVAGWLLVEPDGKGKAYPLDVKVYPKHRRKGLGSAMYELAEKETKRTMHPATIQSQEAQKFWEQEGRDFGPETAYERPDYGK